MDRWCGKVALVTGASSGIGASIAVELVKNGLQVVAVARRMEKVEELKNELEDAPGTLHPLKGDVSKEEDIMCIFEWIRSNLGSIHVLVNNAGLTRQGNLTEGDPNDWRDVLNVNVIGLCICTQQALKLMKETGVDDGHIVHINSIAGHYVTDIGEPAFNIYPASKFAVTALTESLRQELRFFKTNTKISSISPGIVRTEFIDASFNGSVPEDTKDFFSKMPALRPKDIAEAVVYVLSTPPHVQVHELTIRPVGEPF